MIGTRVDSYRRPSPQTGGDLSELDNGQVPINDRDQVPSNLETCGLSAERVDAHALMGAATAFATTCPALAESTWLQTGTT